jgi:molybdopterin synthase catalytic subunit
LLQTKSLKESSPIKKKELHTSEDARWMKKVIEEEHIKPLQVPY